MRKEFVEVLIALSPVFAAEAINLLRIRAVDCGNLNTSNRTRRAGVRFRDISTANQADMDCNTLTES